MASIFPSAVFKKPGAGFVDSASEEVVQDDIVTVANKRTRYFMFGFILNFKYKKITLTSPGSVASNVRKNQIHTSFRTTIQKEKKISWEKVETR
jgi:hypothetical protein